ncbi:MAG: S9 family peptidase [Saprospiraceae bacterium]
MKKVLICMLLTAFSLGAQKNSGVSFEKYLSLRQVGGVQVSPDGNHVLYNVTSTDWNENSFDTEIWLSRNGHKPFQLTQTSKGSSNAGTFSPDSKWISFIADRGNKAQIYLISVDGGEAFAITKDEEGLSRYSWSPDGSKIAVLKPEKESKKDKSIKERYGSFGVEGKEFMLTHIWVMNFNLDSIQDAGQLPCYNEKIDTSEKRPSNPCFKMPKPEQLTEGDFTVGGFEWSPDSKIIAFSRQPDPLINSSIHSDIGMVTIENKNIETIINNPGGDFFSNWSPDGKSILYTSSVDDTLSHYFKNNRVFIYSLENKRSKEILKDVDENKNIFDWNPMGVIYGINQKMKSALFRYDPTSEATTNIQTGMDIPGQVSFSKDGRSMALSGRNFDKLNEIYFGKTGSESSILSDVNSQISDWKLPLHEIVSWKSKDGTEIEGVLIKPSDYDPGKKYPLLLVIHGGPTGIDRPEPTPGGVYPIMQWCEKGAIVLRVNYRGSAGYGAKFRALNVRNLGVGDMWDVMSGVDYLNSKGIVDTSRMACMGWSQGGYISAFLTANTNRFKAISVGAGISNWITYYVSTDITPFTRQYLQSTPWEDMNVYLKTSPMTNINRASTPTLIQHGEFDHRVPISNAYELYRGLQDRKIPSRLIVYKGFGHGITKPKERLAAIWHNWQWINHYVFGDKMEELPSTD